MEGIRALATIQNREMNRTEEKYSRHLQLRMSVGEILWWDYEAVKFRVGHDCWYLPDFLLVNSQHQLEVHEVKAMWKTGKAGWKDDSRVKVRACAEHFPIKFNAAVLAPDGSWQFEEF